MENILLNVLCSYCRYFSQVPDAQFSIYRNEQFLEAPTLIKFIRFQSYPNRLILSSRVMSGEMQKLIVNIEQKFDQEFNEKTEPTQPAHSQPIKQSTEQALNPEIQDSKLSHEMQQKCSNPNALMPGQQKSPDPEQRSHKKQGVAWKKQKNEIPGKGEENIYKSLSTKLESALKKITTQKKVVKTLSKNNTMSILHRFSEHERKKEKQLAEKRNIEEQKKYLGMKPKPDINPMSKKIAEETSYRPIYERFEQILSEKKKKMDLNQSNKKAKQEEEYEKFLSEYQSHVKLQPENCRDAETYFHDMITWRAKLDKEKQDKLKQKQEKEKEGYTFMPELNKKSMKMMKKAKRVPIQERQIERVDTEPSFSFKPRTNKRILK